MGRNNSGGEDTDANIGELIFYNATPSAADLNRIESYLAIKYGITRGGNTNTGAAYNYLSSASTTIWNKTTNSGFNNDIAGIGRDDASALFRLRAVMQPMPTASVPTSRSLFGEIMVLPIK
jgi:hypothetical protein